MRFLRAHRRAAFSLLRWAVVACALAVLAKAGWLLALRLAYEFQGPMTVDTPIYWTVGRGILQGLLPYADLFETKPPGIFLLSAASYALLGDARLMHLLQVAALAGYPVLLAAAWWLSPLRDRWGVTRCALFLLFGVALALYVGDRSGEVQVESFGAILVSIYAVLAWRDFRTTAALVVCAFCLLAGAGLKEPFLLTGLACALIVAAFDRRPIPRLTRVFGLPALVAGTAGTAALALLGYLGPYVSVYLPEMFGRHIAARGSMWERGLRLWELTNDLSAFSAWLGGAIALLFVAAVVLASVSGSSRSAPLRVVFVAAAAYLLSLSVGMGGQYFNHHFVFAVPGYVAAFLVVAGGSAPVRLPRLTSLATLAAGVLLASAATGIGKPDYAEQMSWIRDDVGKAKLAAQRIDGILEACGRESYVFLGANGHHPYTYTERPPVGPLFFQYPDWLDDAHKAFRASLLNNLYQAEIVVIDSNSPSAVHPDFLPYVREHFTRYPWACATRTPMPDPYAVYFRSEGEVASTKVGGKREP